MESNKAAQLFGMKLTGLHLTPKNVTRGMDVLRRMKSLKSIGIGDRENQVFSSEVLWKKYEAGEFNK